VYIVVAECDQIKEDLKRRNMVKREKMIPVMNPLNINFSRLLTPVKDANLLNA